MTKIAYLTGVSGAGKSHIAKLFPKNIHVIEIDPIKEHSALRLCPSLKSDVDAWQFWKAMSKFCDVRTAISITFKERNALPYNPPQSILAEATILVLDEWRFAFRQALEDSGISITNEKLFWFDPPTEILLSRIKKKRNLKQHNLDLQKAQQRQVSFRTRAEGYIDYRYSDSNILVSEISEYFGS